MGNYQAVVSHGIEGDVWVAGTLRSIPSNEVADWAEHMRRGLITPVVGNVGVTPDAVGDAPVLTDVCGQSLSRHDDDPEPVDEPPGP